MTRVLCSLLLAPHLPAATTEASPRPGGRIRTLREPFSDGLYAEAGAGRIPGTHHLTLRYVKQFALPLTPFSPVNTARRAPAGWKAQVSPVYALQN